MPRGMRKVGAAITELGALQGGGRRRMVGLITLYLDYITRVVEDFHFTRLPCHSVGVFRIG